MLHGETASSEREKFSWSVEWPMFPIKIGTKTRSNEAK